MNSGAVYTRQSY